MLLRYCIAVTLIQQAISACTNINLEATSHQPKYVKYPAGRVEYGTDVEECWLIRPDITNRKILITIEIAKIGNGDSIKVYNGQDNTKPELTLQTNTADSSVSVVANASSALVVFDSDATANAGQDKGFTFFYVTGVGSECGGELPDSTSTEQYLTSPNFPSPYGLSTECTWTITADDQNANIELTLKFLDLEYKPSCEYDSLQIIDENGDGTDKICGTDWFPTFVYSSGGNTIEIKMLSDSINAKYGFVLMYKSERDISMTLIIVSIVLTSLSLIGCVWGSLYCVDKL